MPPFVFIDGDGICVTDDWVWAKSESRPGFYAVIKVRMPPVRPGEWKSGMYHAVVDDFGDLVEAPFERSALS